MKRCKMDVCGKIIWPWQKERDGCHDSCKRLDEVFKSSIKQMEKDNPLIAKMRKKNERFKKSYPNNCYIIERTADGAVAGRCFFALKDGVCPRHGKVK